MRLHDPESLLRPSGRPPEFIVGLVVAFLALLFLVLAAYVLVSGIAHGLLQPPFLDRGKLGFLLPPAILLALGIPGAWIAFRLLTGRRRRDGGLLSPGVLRLAGALLIIVPWLWVMGEPADRWRWWHAVSLTSAGIACWILAARRDVRDESITMPPHEPPK